MTRSNYTNQLEALNKLHTGVWGAMRSIGGIIWYMEGDVRMYRYNGVSRVSKGLGTNSLIEVPRDAIF